MEGSIAFEVQFLAQSKDRGDSVSSLDLSFSSCENEDARPVLKRARNKRTKERRYQVHEQAPCTPVRKRSGENFLVRRPNSLGNSEIKRRLRLEELCQKGRLDGRKEEPRDGAVSSIQRLLDTEKSPKKLRPIRRSLRRWSDHPSTTSSQELLQEDELVLAASSTHVPGAFLRTRRRVSLPRSIARVMSQDSTTRSGDQSSTRWAGSTSTCHDESSGHTPRRPERTFSRELERPIHACNNSSASDGLDGSNSSDAPRPPQRTLSREIERELPSCSSFAIDDGEEAPSTTDELRTICKDVLALTEPDEPGESEVVEEEATLPETTAGDLPVLQRTQTMVSKDSSAPSCTSHITRDLPSKLPRRQRSSEVEEPSRGGSPLTLLSYAHPAMRIKLVAS